MSECVCVYFRVILSQALNSEIVGSFFKRQRLLCFFFSLLKASFSGGLHPWKVWESGVGSGTGLILGLSQVPPFVDIVFGVGAKACISTARILRVEILVESIFYVVFCRRRRIKFRHFEAICCLRKLSFLTVGHDRVIQRFGEQISRVVMAWTWLSFKFFEFLLPVVVLFANRVFGGLLADSLKVLEGVAVWTRQPFFFLFEDFIYVQFFHHRSWNSERKGKGAIVLTSRVLLLVGHPINLDISIPLNFSHFMVPKAVFIRAKAFARSFRVTKLALHFVPEHVAVDFGSCKARSFGEGVLCLWTWGVDNGAVTSRVILAHYSSFFAWFFLPLRYWVNIWTCKQKTGYSKRFGKVR